MGCTFCVAQVDTLQQRCTATDAQLAQLHQQVTDLQADKALMGARLHDGSLDVVRGQLIQQLQQQLAESSQAAESAAAAAAQASLQVSPEPGLLVNQHLLPVMNESPYTTA